MPTSSMTNDMIERSPSPSLSVVNDLMSSPSAQERNASPLDNIAAKTATLSAKASTLKTAKRKSQAKNYKPPLKRQKATLVSSSSPSSMPESAIPYSGIIGKPTMPVGSNPPDGMQTTWRRELFPVFRCRFCNSMKTRNDPTSFVDPQVWVRQPGQSATYPNPIFGYDTPTTYATLEQRFTRPSW